MDLSALMDIDIEQNTNFYLKGFNKNSGRLPEERYSSFDYCFNYFREFYENGNLIELANPKNIQISCLQLGFYLASWGMYRGSAFLLQKSVKHFERLINLISKLDKRYWEIDVDSYCNKNYKLLLELGHLIRNSLGEKNDYASDALITKIMLGVFGNVPAYDDNFTKGFGIKVFGKKTLNDISYFYKENKKKIDKIKIYTIDFLTGKQTKRIYTKAKIIDMVGFVEGMKKSIKPL